MNLGFIKLNQEQFFVGMLVIVFAALLWVLFQKTRFGLATRAAAENEKGAVVLGFSPDFLAGTNWVLSTRDHRPARHLRRHQPVDHRADGAPRADRARADRRARRRVHLVPAHDARRVRARHAEAADRVPRREQDVVPALRDAGLPRRRPRVADRRDRARPVPRGRRAPARGSITAGRLPFSPTPPAWAIRIGGPVLALIAAVLGLFVFNSAYRGALSNTLVGIIICLSVVVITGFVGQISLAQMAFAGISAFIVSHLSSEHGWPFPIPIFAGAIVALVIGLLVALPRCACAG